MSCFDLPYYALTKTHMSRIGIWPGQSKNVRVILPLTMFTIALTLVGPGLIRLHDAWRDIDILARSTTVLLMGIAIFFLFFSCIRHFDSIKVSINKIEDHWEAFKNTPAVIVLDKYAERGRYITVVYSTCIYVATISCYVLALSPVIFDFVDPVNKSREKIYLAEAEYGVDADKYYCFIIGHTYIVMTMVIGIGVGIISMYIVGVVHTCALFEVVGFNLEQIANKYTVNKKNAITLRSDFNYKKICDCINLHAEAISFADRIEDDSYVAMGVLLGIITIITVISTVQALINWKRPEVLIQQVALIIAQDMSVNAQKLLIPMMIRSSKPCYFTAGKVYVLSLETFGSAIRTVVSYFAVFAQMI